MVPEKGLEPLHPKAEDFESSMSTIPSPRLATYYTDFFKKSSKKIKKVFYFKIWHFRKKYII